MVYQVVHEDTCISMTEMKNCKYQSLEKHFNANIFGYVYPEDEYV